MVDSAPKIIKAMLQEKKGMLVVSLRKDVIHPEASNSLSSNAREWKRGCIYFLKGHCLWWFWELVTHLEVTKFSAVWWDLSPRKALRVSPSWQIKSKDSLSQKQMAREPFIIEFSSSSSDSAGASNAIHGFVNVEAVSPQVRQTYSDDDDCVIVGETWNKRETEENDDCAIVGENWQIGSSSARTQPVYIQETSQPQAQAAQPSSNGTQGPQRAAAPVARQPSPYVPKGYLVVRRPLVNPAVRRTTSSSSTESDRTCYGDAPLSSAAHRPDRNQVIRNRQGGSGDA